VEDVYKHNKSHVIWKFLDFCRDGMDELHLLFVLVLGRNEDQTRRPLRPACLAQLFLGRDENVRQVILLTINRDVAEDVDGRDISGENDKSFFSFPNPFDDFFHAPADFLFLRGLFDELEDLLRQVRVGQRVSDRRYSPVNDLHCLHDRRRSFSFDLRLLGLLFFRGFGGFLRLLVFLFFLLFLLLLL